MTGLRVLPGLLRVGSVLLAYRLDEMVGAPGQFNPMKYVRPLARRPRIDVRNLPRGERLRLAMTELGRSSSRPAGAVDPARPGACRYRR